MRFNSVSMHHTAIHGGPMDKSDYKAVVIDGKVLGFQWEHIWFMFSNRVTTYPQVEEYMRYCNKHNLRVLWDRDVECLTDI